VRTKTPPNTTHWMTCSSRCSRSASRATSASSGLPVDASLDAPGRPLRASGVVGTP
jgi:hypothetical protein